MSRRSVGLLIMAICLSVPVWSQASGLASVPIVLRIPGSITLSLHSTPVNIAVQSGMQQPFAIPLTVQWNLDPREIPGFGVFAYFRDAHAALVEPSTASTITADNILARWGENQFQPFQSGDVTLFHTAVLPELRRGTESRTLELKIADQTAAALPDGEYQGVLYLEVRNY